MRCRINSLIYFCKDMQTMTTFYQDVMGLRAIRNDHYPADEWAELGGKGFRLCLHKAGNPGCPGRNRNKLVFEVDDVGKARDYLKKHKVRMGKLQQMAGGDACDGRDPEGNKFQIWRPGPQRGQGA